jgi:hypothetical protein
VSNQRSADATAQVVFRVASKQPELWDAVTGDIRDLPRWSDENGRTIVPLEFAPRQSWFVVFRKPRNENRPSALENFPKYAGLETFSGPWEVAFDPKWGGARTHHL